MNDKRRKRTWRRKKIWRQGKKINVRFQQNFFYGKLFSLFIVSFVNFVLIEMDNEERDSKG